MVEEVEWVPRVKEVEWVTVDIKTFGTCFTYGTYRTYRTYSTF